MIYMLWMWIEKETVIAVGDLVILQGTVEIIEWERRINYKNNRKNNLNGKGSLIVLD